MQPLLKTENDVVRFRSNAIVRYLLDQMPGGLNSLASMSFPEEDWRQLAQLIGYSLSGYHELSYVTDESALTASAAAKAQGFDAGGCRDTGCKIHCDSSR